MNPSTQQARAMIGALLKHGVRHVVIAPGSRNSPLSIAAAQAELMKTGLEVFVRIDERTAAFTALGMAKRMNRPVVVLCTSGTAAANFYPAVYEAHEAGVPLIVMTADRPLSVRGQGANQTIEQSGMFGAPIRADWDLPLAQDHDAVYWELAVTQAILTSLGDEFTAPGPVHLNIPFAEPLVPDDGDLTWTQGLVLDELPERHSAEAIDFAAIVEDLGLAAKPIRGVVIISDPHSAQAALTFAQQLQWPVFAEPGSMARTASVGIQHYAEILKDQEFVESHQPDVVITAGRFGLSRSVAAFVKTSVRHIAVGRFPLDADPWRTAVHHLPDFPTATGTAPADGDWLRAWQQKDGQLVSADLEWNSRGVINQYIARLTHHDLVWVSASMPIRIVDDVARLSDSPMMLMNRGANGIDGVIASASGAALVHGAKAHVIIGDVAFIHDASSLFIPSTERHPDLRILVVDNNRGAIFETLEQGASEFSNVFSRIYGTPHASNLAEVAAAAGWASQRVSTFEELESAVEADIQVIVARVPN